VPEQEPGKSKKPPPAQLEPEESDTELLGGVYQSSKTYLKLLLTMGHAILERPATPERPEVAAADICPARPPVPRFLQPKDATVEFQKQVKATLQQLVAEYRESTGGVGTPTPAIEKDFMYYLSTSGKYHNFKEILKKSVVRIVRENFKKDGTESKEEMGNFYNDLYVYLHEQGMDALNTAFDEASRDAVYTQPLAEVGTKDSYIKLAVEAELMGRKDVASKHLDSVVKLCDDDAKLWYDFALFSLRAKDMTKTEACMQEALSLDSTNPEMLLVYGVIFASREAYDDADAFVLAALDHSEEKSVIGWTIRGLMFELAADARGDEDRSDDAKYCHMVAHWTQADIDGGKLPGKERKCRTYKDTAAVDISNHVRGGPCLLQAARFLLDANATVFAEKALQKYETQIAGSSKPPSMEVKLDHLVLQGRLYQQLEELGRAEECFTDAVHKERPRTSRMSKRDAKEDDKPEPPSSIYTVEFWTYLAHCQFLQKKEQDAIKTYEKVLTMREEPLDNTVYLRLGLLLVSSGTPEDLEKAKQVFLKGCISFPTATAWLGVGTACYLRHQYEQAEEALVEANIMDIDNGVVWAYLCLVCMQLQRDEEADKALECALRRGIDRPEVLRELGFVYVAAGKPAIAESALREALKMEENAAVRRALADSLTAQNDPEAAIAEYKTVVNTYENEDDHQHARSQLYKLLTSINRPGEASKYQDQ